MTTGAASEREGALYVAQDQGFFRRYGLDLTLVQARNGPVGMAALSSGESFMHWGSVSGANLGAIAEGADLIFVAGFINRLTGVFAANPKIRKPDGSERQEPRGQQPERRHLDFYHADA